MCMPALHQGVGELRLCHRACAAAIAAAKRRLAAAAQHLRVLSFLSSAVPFAGSSDDADRLLLACPAGHWPERIGVRQELRCQAALLCSTACLCRMHLSASRAVCAATGLPQAALLCP